MSSKDETLHYLMDVMRNLKDYKTDMAHDLLKIFEERSKRFKKDMSYEEAASIHQHIDDVKPYVMKPRSKNKIYVISEIEQIHLIAFKVSDFEIKQLIRILEKCIDRFDLDPVHIATVYIFNRDKIVFRKDLFFNEFDMIIRYFNSRNLNPSYDIKEYNEFSEFYFK